MRRAAVVGLVLGACLGSAGPLKAACPEPGGLPAHVVALDERLEAMLDNGSRVRFWGVDSVLRDNVAPSRAREQLNGWLADREFAIRPSGTVPDRWGRIAVHAFAPTPAGPLSVGQALIDAGLARVRIEASDPACVSFLLQLEAAARIARLGLWGEPDLMPLDTGHPEEFGAYSGKIVLAEGDVSSQNDAGFGVFLNFGSRRGRDVSALVRHPLLAQFVAAGLAPASLIGHKVRIRGLLDARFGPQIELESPLAVEPISNLATRSPYSGLQTR